jgi:hypothetical protein
MIPQSANGRKSPWYERGMDQTHLTLLQKNVLTGSLPIAVSLAAICQQDRKNLSTPFLI